MFCNLPFGREGETCNYIAIQLCTMCALRQSNIGVMLHSKMIITFIQPSWARIALCFFQLISLSLHASGPNTDNGRAFRTRRSRAD